MKTSFRFPPAVKEFLKTNKLKTTSVRKSIFDQIEEDLLDKKYKPLKVKEILVVINGLCRGGNKVFLSPKSINKKSPLRTISATNAIKGYSIYYLIFKKR